jgi:hypothetical protein
MLALPCQGTQQKQQSGDAGETVVATATVTTTVVVPLQDGQPQVVTTTSLIYICQIGDGAFFLLSFFFSALSSTPSSRHSSDMDQANTAFITGQIQAHTTPCTGAAPTPVVGLPPVPQISDGQVQVTPGVSAAGVPGAQETAATSSGPAVVPTDAPFVGAAAGGVRARAGAAALMVGLGVAVVGWV